jgi:hypothetical protein
MASYPASLPHLFRLSHQEETLGMDVLRTSMSTGPKKTRPRTSSTPDDLALGHNALTEAHKATLTTFFKETLVGGALSFSMTDPEGGSGTFRFTAAPKFKPVGDSKYSVSIQLERL